MAAVLIGITAQMVGSPTGPDAIYLFALIGIFFIVAFLHGEFKLLIYGIVYLFFLPTMYLILIMYAMANMHDQAWGTRDGGVAAKETDEDKFISISKIGQFLRTIKQTFREALANEAPVSEDETDKKEKDTKKQSDPQQEEADWKKKKSIRS